MKNLIILKTKKDLNPTISYNTTILFVDFTNKSLEGSVRTNNLTNTVTDQWGKTSFKKSKKKKVA